MTNEQIGQILQRIANGFVNQVRAPIMRTPAEVGLSYDDVTFPSRDGTPLEGWFIPAHGSTKVVIANHPSGFSRSGLPGHLEPWKSVWAASGNDFEVDFVPDYRTLHDAGYHVLAYDLRNHGHSGAANGGIGTSGVFEARDVVGSIQYVRTRPDTRDMTVGLFSRCLGANATFAAMTQFPAEFRGVRCLAASQPVTTRTIIEKQLMLAGVPPDRVNDDLMADLSRRMVVTTSIGLDRRTPQEWVANVNVPTLLYQAHDDVLTDPTDVQTMFNRIPIAQKELHWVHGTKRRWDGYLELQRHPKPILDWFASYMD